MGFEPKTFRAVPIDELGRPTSGMRSLTADGDLAAFLQARACFGIGGPFELWEGERMVLKHRPVPASQNVTLRPVR